MRTQVKALYEAAKTKYKLTLHAGQSGMSNSASWVYLAEDINNAPFLKGGEMAITTGLFRKSGITLYEFIRTLATYNCSGIVLNVGQYLHPEDITPEITEFCDTNQFPLFTMPWEIHLVDIMQEFCSLFIRESRREDQLSAAFQSAVYQIPTPENALRTLAQYGFSELAEYRVLAIRNLTDSTQVTSPLNSCGLKYHLFPHENLQVLIYDTARDQLPLEKVIEVVCFCDSITLGVSDKANSLREIGEFYKHARFALSAAEFWKRPFVRFDQLGTFQMLFCVSNPALLKTMYEKQLAELEAYDLQHDLDYMDTLRMFLLSDCNLLETAARMHAHRNTIVYRIRKIKDILHTELDNSMIKFDLLLAFYIREYLSI